MISVYPLFEETELELMYEGFIQKFKSLVSPQKKTKLEQLMKKQSVERFLEISGKLVINEKLSISEKQLLMKLLNDRDVKKYLEEVNMEAKRVGQVIGATLGVYTGAAAGLFAAAGLGAAASAAVASGLVFAIGLGYGGAKLGKWLGGIAGRRQSEDTMKKRVAGISATQTSVNW
jgi:hypothetical protein